MDGIPESVSAVMRTSFTSLFPRRAYSQSHIAAKMLTGAAITSDTIVIATVVINAGINDTFSLL
jgi:hypothetical protein